ncbi:unnamed protein product [Vitrella brassicaformis CCMP3155]|uniref:Uncharacterized protein n=1 Tax=Vitrella brassicaformis (strain CCMP3155) TaxID=1169540 RepID=A0A0G4EYW1_VITBC|nr:unnamed protein product [Vitrella brassicaformis CCMP3155]|eukprot:CEM04136.1 unnamed protein product [Vitrella brassicaformis CCMP3155]
MTLLAMTLGNIVRTHPQHMNKIGKARADGGSAQLNLDAVGRYPTEKPVAMQGALSSLSGGSFVEVAAASRQASDALSVTPEDVRKQLKEWIRDSQIRDSCD